MTGSAQKEYDVVVVGSGAGGFSAAVTARLEGLEVLVLEKEPLIGGTTARAAGGMWIPNNPMQEAAGIKDSPEQARTYIEYSAGNNYDQARTEAFIRNSPEMLSYFEARTALKFFVAPGHPDYHPDAPGSLDGGRTCYPQPYDGRGIGVGLRRLAPPLPEMTFVGMQVSGGELPHFYNALRSIGSLAFVARRLANHVWETVSTGRPTSLRNGSALLARFMRTALDLDLPVRTSVAASDLIVENGKVVGVETAGGERVRARRGVVLASGGFPHDMERRKKLYPHAPTGREHWSPTPVTNTGDGLRMAERASAKTVEDLSAPAAWTPVSLVPRGDGTTGIFPHFLDRAKPGAIAITRKGVRFTNEANAYPDFCRALLAACEGEDEVCCFNLMDSRAFRKYGLGAVRPYPVPHGRHLKSGYLVKGDTLGELARKAGIDAPSLEKTVADYNIQARQGQDPVFGRGSNAYNRYFGDAANKPNPCVAPVDQGPYYAVKMVMGDLGTFDGLSTDAHARVLDAERQPIPGLYAVGNDQASVFGGAYPGGGATLGPAMTFGYLAGKHIASLGP